MEVFQELGSDNATEILLEIRNDVKCMNRKFDSLDKKVKNLRNDNKVLKKQNTKLVDQVSELSSTVVNLETRVKEAEKNPKTSRPNHDSKILNSTVSKTTEERHGSKQN